MASLERELRRLQQHFRKEDRTHQHTVQELQEEAAAMQQAVALAQQERQALETALVASETRHQNAMQAQLQAMADCEALAYTDKQCHKQCLLSYSSSYCYCQYEYEFSVYSLLLLSA